MAQRSEGDKNGIPVGILGDSRISIREQDTVSMRVVSISEQSLRNWKNYKRSNASIPEVDDVVLIWEEHVSRQNWLLGRIIELIPSRDGVVRGAKVIVGKTRAVIERPINMLYPVEYAVEKEHRARCVPQSNTVEIVDSVNHNDNDNDNDDDDAANDMSDVRPRRKAAIAAMEKMSGCC